MLVMYVYLTAFCSSFSLLFIVAQGAVHVYQVGKLLDNFLVSNGVRQGVVLYPILFAIYIDDLLGDLGDLCKLGVGCHWDSVFTGAVRYADDLVLLAPSLSALRIMLNCCENFAIICGLKFNSSTSITCITRIT